MALGMQPDWLLQTSGSISEQGVGVPQHPSQSASTQQLPPARHWPSQQTPPVHAVMSAMGVTMQYVSTHSSVVQELSSLQSARAQQRPSAGAQSASRGRVQPAEHGPRPSTPHDAVQGKTPPSHSSMPSHT